MIVMAGQAKPRTVLTAEGDGVIVDGRPFSVYLALEDARRDKASHCAFWRDKERFDVRTDVAWDVREWAG